MKQIKTEKKDIIFDSLILCFGITILASVFTSVEPFYVRLMVYIFGYLIICLWNYLR